MPRAASPAAFAELGRSSSRGRSHAAALQLRQRRSSKSPRRRTCTRSSPATSGRSAELVAALFLAQLTRAATPGRSAELRPRSLPRSADPGSDFWSTRRTRSALSSSLSRRGQRLLVDPQNSERSLPRSAETSRATRRTNSEPGSEASPGEQRLLVDPPFVAELVPDAGLAIALLEDSDLRARSVRAHCRS